MYEQRAASLVDSVDKNKNFFRARKSLGTSLALQCHAEVAISGFHCRKVA